MKFVDEFRNPEKASALVRSIEKTVANIDACQQRPLQIMEFCGGHTHTLFKYGIDALLPPQIEMVHGPGCPVCVLPMGRVDDCIAIAECPGVIFTTFGDAMRVPGSKCSLLEAKAQGCDVRMVYSPMDALTLARKNPNREVVFFALGFETTMPSTALTVLQAAKEEIGNFSLFCNHITTVPTLKAILESPDMKLDAFLAPGHVSMVVGTHPFDFVADVYHKPIVITGFEPLDVLQSLYRVVRQIAEGRAEVENQYRRVVSEKGNPQGLAAIAQVFESRRLFEWRGLGAIDQSGVRIRDDYAGFDAERKFGLPNLNIADPKSCQCGDVLKGVIKPYQCNAYGKACTPQTPMGALMVSSEGACAAYFNNGYRENDDGQHNDRISIVAAKNTTG